MVVFIVCFKLVQADAVWSIRGIKCSPLQNRGKSPPSPSYKDRGHSVQNYQGHTASCVILNP